jgi:hypothetical protein
VALVCRRHHKATAPVLYTVFILFTANTRARLHGRRHLCDPNCCCSQVTGAILALACACLARGEGEQKREVTGNSAIGGHGAATSYSSVQTGDNYGVGTSGADSYGGGSHAALASSGGLSDDSVVG